MSDFPVSAARASEGHCPLCDGRLAMFGRCDACDVSWILTSVEDGKRPALIPTGRNLTTDEIRKLYDRETEEGSS